MSVTKFCFYLILLLAVLTISAWLFAVASSAQTTIPDQLRPDAPRIAFAYRQSVLDSNGREGGYVPTRGAATRQVRSPESNRTRAVSAKSMSRPFAGIAGPIAPGTALHRILHTSQLSLTSIAGSDEELLDTNGDVIQDQRKTFDNAGGSTDLAVGQSGARYEVFPGTLEGRNVGILVLALDTNGDYVVDTSSKFDLRRYFDLPSAVAVVTGTSKSGREFVVVSSSGYYNSADPGDPNNEPSPGVILMVRDPVSGLFDDSRTRTLVRVGDNRLYNANALALLPNNDLLIADFHSNELRIIRDTDGDGMPDQLSAAPYYSYRFSDDAPLDIAVNSRGVVFSHTAGNDVVMLALYDDNTDGIADRDEVVVAGLSIDDNLLLHGLTVDRVGNVYVIEDASGPADGASGNGSSPRIDAFPDPWLDGFLRNGAIFFTADDPNTQGLSGLAFGDVLPNQINDGQFFVRQHYLDFLNRNPDGPGLNYWTSQITQCGNNDLCTRGQRITVSAAFFIEQEFQDTGSFVYRFYKSSYGRRPTNAEFVVDRAGVIGGADLEAKKQAFANDWVARAAFQQIYPTALTADQFVNKLFDTAALVPFAAERQQLIADMQNGKTRAQVLREVTEISAFKTREYNPSFVLMQYFGYLRRNPDQGGYDFWLNVLNNRAPNNYRGMVCAFITSREYQERFGPQLRRTNADCQ
ncbi:MAG: hypothetical protein JWM21_2323 [Acidobacteria bacterium]|nr:hypothetical protein [Acidobacteriota bacterium]